MILDFIKKYFPSSNLEPTESYIYSDIHLRFELGDGYENGTKERVNHCFDKVVEIFEKLFDDNDDLILVIKSFKYEGASEFYKPTDNYLEKQITNIDKTKVIENIVTLSETDEFYDIEKDITEEATIITHHIQKIFETKLSNINYKNILKGIANLEMGFDPSISDSIYFINKSRKVALHMYDDRGCMVYAANKKTIQFLYDERYDWLVKYHIETFDKIFKNA